MKKLIQPGLLALLIAGAWPASASAQAIANPLVRPAILTEGKEPPNSAAGAGTSVQAGRQGDTEEVRREAARRITQEDLNIRQQALNSPVVPLGLVDFFSNMQVTAHIQNAIVMRKISNEVVQNPLAANRSQVANNQANQEAQAAAFSNVSRSTAVIRLRVGQVVNLAGYSVRAKVTGQDVTVDWLSDKGIWVNVFFGALESSNGGFALVPADSQLLQVDTQAFNYLIPKLNAQAFSPNTSGGSQQGNSGSSFGGGVGGGGGNLGFGQPGFGSSTPF